MDPRIPEFAPTADLRQVALSFHRAGIVVVRRAIDDATLSRLRQACDRILAAVAHQPALALRLADERQFNRVPWILQLDPEPQACTAVLDHAFVWDLAELLLGVDAVCTGDVLVVKTSGTASTFPVHADCEPIPPARLGRRWFVNVALYLDEASAANGCLAVLPGSHCSPVALDDLARRRDHFADLSPVEAAAGDVVVHHGALVHGSPASRSAAPRRTLYFEFHPFMPSYLNGEARPGLPMSRDEVLARRRLRERARHLSSTAGSRVHG